MFSSRPRPYNEPLDKLFKGKPDERFVVTSILGENIVLLRNFDPSSKEAALCIGNGSILPVKGRPYYELNLKSERPKFGKGVHVLAMKPTENGKYEVNFRPAVVQSRKLSDDKRKMYNLQFDDGTNAAVHEEFVIPTKDKWNTKEQIYYLPGSEPEDAPQEGEEKEEPEKEKEEEKEESSESDSSSDDDEKKKHKKRHHHHHKKHNKRENQAPQIIIMPIFVPMQPYMI